MSNVSFYSYGQLIKNRNDFRITDRVGINRFDTPNALFYKLVFYFSDESGLLGLDGINGYNDDVTDGLGNIDVKKDRIKNTAYNFLLLNDELERAEMLKNFLILLSEINTKSPWYFQDINGIDGALVRKVFSEGEMKLEDNTRQFTIKCLKDAYDDRIGTLLDLYRACCFSYQNKKEIVPRNLRKFNMGILLFSAPIRGKGGKSGDPNNRIKIPSSGDENEFYIPSTKLIEFRNCEFDYNSVQSAFGTISTSDGPFSPEYTITINYDDCYESRYNEIMQEVITDFINIDINKERDNTYSDIKLYGKEIDYDVIHPKLNNDENGKDYWIETQFISEMNEQSPYSVQLYKPTEEEMKKWRVNSDYNPLTSALNDAKDEIEGFFELPSFNKEDENIHDRGRVTRFGEFEYLNRMSGSGGFVGELLQQGVGTGVKALKDGVSKIYLGNLYEMSLSNVLYGNDVDTNDDERSFSSRYSSKNLVKKEIWPDPTQRETIFNPITKEIHDGGIINRNLNKGDILDVDLVNHTMGTENETYEVLYATKNIHENTNKLSVPKRIPKRKIDPEGNSIPEFITTEIWPDPTQREQEFNPVTDEIWPDTTQREITSNKPIEKLPGYVNTRTNLLNKLNKKSSIRNNL